MTYSSIPDSQATPAPTESGITDGPLQRAILKLAIPAVFGMLMQFVLSTTNIFWVGRLGAAAQDAVTTAMLIIWIPYSLTGIVSIGVTALVSRWVGAREPDRAALYAGQGILVAALLGLVTTVIGSAWAGDIVRLLGASPDTAAMAIPYVRIGMAFTALGFVLETIYSIFRAAGKSRPPAFNFALVVVLNLVLDPLLIFGIGPFPELGVPGAALATTISEIIGLILISFQMYRGDAGVRPARVNLLRLVPAEARKIVTIGLPIATQYLIFTFVYWFLIRLVHEFGEAPAAAMGIGNRMESFSYLTCTGFALAASTMVGQNLGAGQPARAARAAWMTVLMACGATLITSIAFLAFPTAIARAFSDDPTVIRVAHDYLIVLGISQMFMAVEIVLEGAFSGAGDTLPPMLVMIPGAALRIPLSYYLAQELNWGVNGVWWTLTITTILKSLVLAFWFTRNRWQHRKV